MFHKANIARVLCLVFLLSIVPVTPFAGTYSIDTTGEGGIITPYWAGVAQVKYSLACSAGKANPRIDVEVDSSKVDKVNFKGSLLQYKNNQWTTIASWNANRPITLNHSLFNESYSISSGYDYKFVTTVKAYKGSTLVDTIDLESATKWY